MSLIYFNRVGFIENPKLAFNAMDHDRSGKVIFCIWSGNGNYDLVRHTQLLKMQEKIRRLSK